ncbi:MAG: hypothetical protein E6H71_02745 [Betaproteobacteria bacterium]|nr:MAG: hypothetical protein E6H71_02745 [Betaproteobacteria bacterium]
MTLLFTDIEGSTRLWETQQTAMRAALTRHDALLPSSICSHRGHVFKTVGDAFCAAFHTAPAALCAALEARDGDYFGAPLNRVARLVAAGHGAHLRVFLQGQGRRPPDGGAEAQRGHGARGQRAQVGQACTHHGTADPSGIGLAPVVGNIRSPGRGRSAGGVDRARRKLGSVPSLSAGTLFPRAHDGGDVARGVGYFEQAIALDPGFALAWTGLSRGYWTQAGFGWSR